MATRVKKSTNGTSSKGTVLRVKASAQQVQAPVRSKKTARVSPQDLDQRIRERAYHNYVNRGCSGGSEQQDWQEAERQIKSELGLN